LETYGVNWNDTIALGVNLPKKQMVPDLITT